MARVLLFGRLADTAGWREREVEGARLSAIRARLAEDAGLAAALAGPGVQAAVNQAIVRDDPALAAADEVAFLPPFSGG